MELPDLLHGTYQNATVYSNKHGLFSVGGKPSSKELEASNFKTTAGNEVFNLQKRSNGKMEWKQMKKMKNEHYYPSACMINDEKLFVAAGFGSAGGVKRDTKIEMCDVETGEWTQLTDCKLEKSGAGIFYDSIQDTVYLGGSNYTSVECYDLNKNKWSLLPECNLVHTCNPAIWKDDNVLYIASIAANGMEFIDLRESNASWTVKYGNRGNKKRLQTILDATFNGNIQESWLLPFS